MARTFARYWLPALVWTAIVLAASSDPFSAQNTGTILTAIALYLFKNVDLRILGVVHFLIRKSAHFTEYGILSLLWFRAWRGGSDGFRWRWGLAGVAVALATAITDEVHQGFVPSRGSSGWDVLLDLTGAVTVQVVVWAWMRRRAVRLREVSAAPKEA